MEVLKVLVVLVVGGALYFLPSIITINRDHRHWLAIQILNLLLGWTVVGWVIALVWSLMDQPTQKPEIISDPSPAAERIPCPECAELILPVAKKCRHCGAELSGA